MAFPGDWNRRVAVDIQSSQVPSNLTNFPVLLNEDTLPAEMLDSNDSNRAQSDGGDIRITSDEAGNTQLALEVVEWTQDATAGNRKAQLWTKVASVSSSADTTIYVWYNTAGTDTQPAVGASFGRNAVWSGFTSVWHLEEEQSGTGTAGVYTDATGGGRDGDDEVSATGQDGQIGNGQEFDATDDSIEFDGYAHGSGGFAYAAWVKANAGYDVGTDPRRTVISNNDSGGILKIYDDRNTGARFGFQRADEGAWPEVTTTTQPTDDTWERWWGVYDGTDVKMFRNGSQVATASAGGSGAPKDNSAGTATIAEPVVNETNTDYFFDGFLDEIYVLDTLPSSIADWITAEYNNQSSPSTFAIEGTPEDVGSGLSIAIVMHHRRLMGMS